VTNQLNLTMSERISHYVCECTIFPAVNLKHRDGVFAVDLVAGRVAQCALGHVTLQALAAAGERQAKGAQEDTGQLGQFLGVGREVPGLDAMRAQLHHFQVANAGRRVVSTAVHHGTLKNGFFGKHLGFPVKTAFRMIWDNSQKQCNKPTLHPITHFSMDCYRLTQMRQYMRVSLIIITQASL